jgi:hypothetical protein
MPSGYTASFSGTRALRSDGGDTILVLDGAADYVIPLGSEAAFDIGNTDFSLFARCPPMPMHVRNRRARQIWKSDRRRRRAADIRSAS